MVALTLAAGLNLSQLQSGNADSSVMTSWQTQGQPQGAIDQNVVYVRAVEEDDRVNRVRDQQTGDNVSGNAQETVTYMRVWRVYWVFEGPASYDNARILKSAFLNSVATGQTNYNQLTAANLSIIPDAKAPVRSPAEWPGGQWGERVDWDCCFNELVTEVTTVPAVAAVDVTINNYTSPPPLATVVIT
jgi:hypothetical protein